jgi:hypothetical protein
MVAVATECQHVIVHFPSVVERKVEGVDDNSSTQ